MGVEPGNDDPMLALPELRPGWCSCRQASAIRPQDFGSSALTVDVLRAELLDELRLMVNPVALGAGASVLKGADLTDFDLLRTRPFKAGNIQLTYAPKG